MDSDQISRLDIAGELNIFTASSLRDRLLAALGDNGEVEADLSGVTEIDSAGVQLMLAAMRHAKAQDKRLRFGNPSPVVLDVLRLFDIAAEVGLESAAYGQAGEE